MEKLSLKATCLINNYNYEEFVLEAIESALSQTMCFEEIIIVDDKSTDNSIAVIQERYSGSSTIKIVEQEKNQGQLSAFNRGFLESSGDIICFLDADDIYKPGYLATVLQVYQEHAECDCIFSAQENFYGDNHKAEAQQDNSSCRVEDLGYSIISTYFTKVWGGVPTSGISFRRKGLELILPVPYTDDWRIRADDCLVYGASIAGLRRFRMYKKLVKYRIHSRNGFAGKTQPEKRKIFIGDLKRQVSLNRFFNLMIQKMDYDTRLFCDLAVFEFKTISRPKFKQLWFYASLVLQSTFSIDRKIIYIVTMIKYMVNSRKGWVFELDLQP